MARKDIVVVGSSMGGIDALIRLVADLPDRNGVSYFIVQHTSPESPGHLAGILDQAGKIPASTAIDGETIKTNHIYVAPPDRHLLVKEGFIRVLMGPRENRSRPAIDPLFRSAAVAYTSRVTGVILTGLLDDGTAGLYAVKRCGGTAIVQSPDDAEYPDMPKSAISHVEVDHVLPLDQIGLLLGRITREPAEPFGDLPEEVKSEARIAEAAMSGKTNQNKIGQQEDLGTIAPFICPECGGSLWMMPDENIRRYRCHVGHVYTSNSLLADKDEEVESALWAAYRVLQERFYMMTNLASAEREAGRLRVAGDYETKARETMIQAGKIQKLLLQTEE